MENQESFFKKESKNEIVTDINYETIKKYGDIVSVLLLLFGYLLGIHSPHDVEVSGFAGMLREKAKKRILEKAVRSGDIIYNESLEKIKLKEDKFQNINPFLRKAPTYFSLLNIVLLIGVFYVSKKFSGFDLRMFDAFVIVLLFSSFILFFKALGFSYNYSKTRAWIYFSLNSFIFLFSLMIIISTIFSVI